MLTLTLTVPELPLTADQFADLPHPEGFRLELTDGDIVVMAAAQTIWQSNVARRMEDLLRAQGKITVREVGVVVGKRDVPVPDVSVFKDAPANLRLSQVPAADVSCVIDDSSDATIAIFKLTPAGAYGLASSHKLRDLEDSRTPDV